MAKSIIRGFGISLLSLCLGLAFLSNDHLIGSLKATPDKNLSSNQAQISEIEATIFGSFDQEESKEKDSSDDACTAEINSHEDEASPISDAVSFAPKNRSYILQDLYLSLPPPV
jgi:hypothetical protein